MIASGKNSPTKAGVLSIPSQRIKRAGVREAGTKKRASCKPLATQFRHDGFDFRQIAREGMVAIYEQSKNGRVMAFEVVRTRRREAFEIKGRKVEAAEFYPRSKEWGTHGWTVRDCETAFRKMRGVSK